MSFVGAWSWLIDLLGYALLLLAATSAWWIPALKHVAAKWLDQRFAEKLQKADQQFQQQVKESEQRHDTLVRHLQSSIDREFDRATRLHTKEFEALTKCWRSIHKAYWLARQATASFQHLHSMQAMSPLQVQSFIDNCPLLDWQKEELRQIASEEERDSYYNKALRESRWRECMKARDALVMLTDRNAIFLMPNIRDMLDGIEKLVTSAVLELQTNLQYGTRDDEAAKKLRQGESLYKELETAIHARVWSSALSPIKQT